MLFALRFRPINTRAVTAQITSAVVEWALARGWHPRIEARVSVESKGSGGLGFIDVIVRRAAGEAALAIEIDSTDKPWSVAKLRHAVAAGMQGIWIRWGDDEWAGVYDDIDVIQLRASHHPDKTRGTQDQISIW
jgi:hypothetical protein